MSLTPPSESRTREDWIDLARAASVVLVVLYHVDLWHLAAVASPATHEAQWTSANNVAGGFRMPLLLMLSGMLASGKIRRGRPALRSAAANYWLYAVWTTIYAVAYALVALPTPEGVRGLADWAGQLVRPETPLWYVWALAVYMTGLWLLRRVPSWLVLAGLLVPIATIDAGHTIWLKMPVLAFYFALGAYTAPWLRGTVRHRTWRVVGMGLVGVGLTTVLLHLLPATFATLQLAFVVGNVGKGLLALGLCRFVSMVPVVDRIGAWVGRHTLTIYVFHPLLLGGWMLATTGTMHAMLLRLGALAVIYPLVLTLAIVGAALLLEQGLRRVGANFLFGLPAPLQHRLLSWERGPVAEVTSHEPAAARRAA